MAMAGTVGSRPDIYRMLESITFTANSIVQRQLPRDHGLKRLFLRLRIDVTQAGGGATVIDDNPMTLIRMIRISGTIAGMASTTIKQMSGVLAYWAAFFKRGIKPYKVELASGGAQANTILECIIPLDFYATNVVESGGSILPCYAYKDLILEIQWGAVTDLLSAGGTINSASVAIMTHEIPGLTDTDFARNLEHQMLFPVTQTSTDAQIFDLPLAGAYKSLMFRTVRSSAAARQQVDTILSGNLRIDLNGQTNLRLVNAKHLQEANAWMYGDGPSPIQTDAAGTRALALGTEFNPKTGLYFVDFAANMGTDGLVDASRASSFRVNGDLTAVADTPQVECLVNRFEAG